MYKYKLRINFRVKLRFYMNKKYTKVKILVNLHSIYK